MRLSAAIEEFLAGYFTTNRRSERTRTAYEIDLRQFAESVNPTPLLAQVDARSLECWAQRLASAGYAPRSIRRKLAALRVFFQYWFRRGVLSESPFWRVHIDIRVPRTLPKVLTHREIGRLLQFAEARLANSAGTRRLLALRDRALLEVLYATGARIGELVGLNTRDYSAAEGVIVILGKGKQERIALLPDTKSKGALDGYLEARGHLTDALFLNVRGQRITAQGAAQAVGKLALGSGIERRVTPHLFRHTIATQLLERGADIRMIQAFLGHSSIATTQRYTHVTQRHLRTMLANHHPSLFELGRSPKTTVKRWAE